MEVENSSVRVSNAKPASQNDSTFGEYYGGDSLQEMVMKDSWVEEDEIPAKNYSSSSSARQDEGI